MEEPLLEASLRKLRASREDLDVRPGRWETRMTLDPVEAVLRDPVGAANYGRELSDGLAAAGGPAGLLDDASRILKAPAPRLSHDAVPALPGLEALGLSREASDMILELALALEEARALVQAALGSLPPDARRRAASQVLSILVSAEPARPDPAAFDDMARFDLAPMIEAGRRVAAAAEAAIPHLSRPASRERLRRKEWRLPFGKVVVSGPGDDDYGPGDLEGTALLVDLGGNNAYKGPVAAAGEGEAKLVIDLGKDVSVEASSSAASGLLGVGLLYLPNPEGKKTLKAGDLSWGAGVLGVGSVQAAGPASFESGKLSQGAAAVGVGVLWAAGGSTLTARTAAQGFGFSRGIGLLVSRGDGSRLRCLDEPDPREPKASVSLCQGMGYGPRAFAAGGLGLASISGNGNALQAGYFAQGSGYWHGLGALAVRGDGNSLKARRYAQGAGVHAAAGILSVQGQRNTLVNWGAGPAIGWDHGVGLFALRGDSNTAQADWAAGRGDANGHGLAVVDGADNRLSLPELGSGYMRRGAPSYGLAVVRGRGNRLRFTLSRTPLPGPLELSVVPWGLLDADEGLTLDPALELPGPSWSDPPRTEAARREALQLETLYREAAALPVQERLAKLLFIASAFSLDRGWPAKARRDLLALPPAELPALVELVEPDRFDELSWLRPLLAAHPSAPGLAAARAGTAEGLLKALLLAQLRYGTTEGAAPLLEALGDPDWRVRAAAAASLGALYSREGGDEPGRLRLLNASVAPTEEALLKAAGRQRPADLLAVLALDPEVAAEERGRLMDRIAGPADPVGPEAMKEFWAVLSRRLPEDRRKRLRGELRRMVEDLPKVRRALRRPLEAKEEDKDVLVSALTALGQIGSKEDAPLLSRFLKHGSAVVRESAASALGRMGGAGAQALSRALKAADPGTRALAAIGAAQSWDTAGPVLLERALGDDSPEVRAAALSAAGAMPSCVKAGLRSLRAKAAELAEKDPSPSVRACAAAALSALPAASAH